MRYFKKNDGFLLFLVISSIIGLCIVWFCDCKYSINDDIFISSIASGVYGKEYSHCLIYSKSLLGWMIRGLNHLYIANYYMIIQYLLLVVVSALFASVVVERCKNTLIGLCSLLLWWALMYIYIYIDITYTIIAGISSIIGLIGLVVYCNNNHLLSMVSLSVSVFGYMYRRESFLLVLPFVVLFVLLNIRKHKKNLQVKKIVLYLTMLSIIISAVELTDLYTYRTNEWKDFLIQNNLRSTLMDYNNEYNKDDIDINWSANDYAMFYSWRNDNEQKFGTENLSKIVDKSILVFQGFDEILEGIKAFFFNTFPICQKVLLILLIISTFAFGNRQFVASLLFILVSIVVVSILLYFGRFPYRVSYICFFCMTTCIYINMINDAVSFKSTIYKLLIVGLCMVLIVQLIIRKKDVNISEFNLFNKIKQDNNHFYVLDSDAFNEMKNYYRPFNTIPNTLMNNFVLLGGWVYPSPLSRNRCSGNGGTNALDILGYRGDTLFVTHKNEDGSKIVETYLKENSNPNIKLELVEQIGGGYLVYRINKDKTG